MSTPCPPPQKKNGFLSFCCHFQPQIMSSISASRGLSYLSLLAGRNYGISLGKCKYNNRYRTTKNNPIFPPKQFPNKNQKNPVVRLGKWMEVLRGFQQTQVSLVRANHSCRSGAKIISFPSFGQVYTYWIQWRVWHENFPKFPLGEFFRFHVKCQDCAVLRMSNWHVMPCFNWWLTALLVLTSIQTLS